MSTYDITVRTKDGRPVVRWLGLSGEEAGRVIATAWDTLPEPVARRRKAAVKAKKEKTA